MSSPKRHVLIWLLFVIKCFSKSFVVRYFILFYFCVHFNWLWKILRFVSSPQCKYMNFIYLKSLFITWMVYLDPTYWPAPSWLVSSVGRALHRFRRGHGFKSRTGLNFFFQVLFSTTSSVVFLAARISEIRFFTAVQIYEFYTSKIIIHHVDGHNILTSSQLAC